MIYSRWKPITRLPEAALSPSICPGCRGDPIKLGVEMYWIAEHLTKIPTTAAVFTIDGDVSLPMPYRVYFSLMLPTLQLRPARSGSRCNDRYEISQNLI